MAPGERGEGGSEGARFSLEDIECVRLDHACLKLICTGKSACVIGDGINKVRRAKTALPAFFGMRRIKSKTSAP